MTNCPLAHPPDQKRRPRLAVLSAALVLAALSRALPAHAQNAAPRPTLNVTDYKINLELRPADHSLDATTQVTFTPLADMPSAIFDLHGALLVDKVTDAKGAPLNGARGAGGARTRRAVPAACPF